MKGGNSQLPNLNLMPMRRFNEAALHEGRKSNRRCRRKSLERRFNEAALHEGRKSGNVRTILRLKSFGFNEAALHEGRKSPPCLANRRRDASFNEAALHEGRK